MTKQNTLGGSFTHPGTSVNVELMGYGAMQVAGPHVYGPPRADAGRELSGKSVPYIYVRDLRSARANIVEGSRVAEHSLGRVNEILVRTPESTYILAEKTQGMVFPG